MDRRDIMWAGVRLFGVYFVAKAIEAFAALSTHAVSYLRYDDPLAAEDFEGAMALSSVQLIAERGMINSGIWLAVALGAAFYFLRRGDALVRFANRTLGPDA